MSLVAFCATTAVLATSSTVQPTSPIVTLDQAEFKGTTANSTNKFFSIPYAQPPSVVDCVSALCPLADPPTDRVGNLRFRLPQSPGPYVGKHNSTTFGLSCSQQAPNLVLPEGLPNATLEYLETIGTSAKLSAGEDCEERILNTRNAMLMIVVGLTVNVIAPANATPYSKLPVVVVCTL